MHSFPIFAAIILCLSPVAFSNDSVPPPPGSLATLRESYQAAVIQAVSPLAKTYVGELHRFKADYTNAGDQQSAAAVDRELKAMKTLTGYRRRSAHICPKSFEVLQMILQEPLEEMQATSKDLESCFIPCFRQADLARTFVCSLIIRSNFVGLTCKWSAPNGKVHICLTGKESADELERICYIADKISLKMKVGYLLEK